MKRLGDQVSENSVSIAFQLMRNELETEVENLNSKGAQLFRESRYDEARSLSERGKNLAEFCSEVERLRANWEDNFAELFPQIEETEAEEISRKLVSGSKSPKSGLLIRLPNGEVISERYAADTLVKFIDRVGLEDVADLDIKLNSEPLVSKVKSKKYDDRFLQGFFIKTHSNTSKKAEIIRTIAKKLGLDVDVQVID